jgi:hypothetical protein
VAPPSFCALSPSNLAVVEPHLHLYHLTP